MLSPLIAFGQHTRCLPVLHLNWAVLGGKEDSVNACFPSNTVSFVLAVNPTQFH